MTRPEAPDWRTAALSGQPTAAVSYGERRTAPRTYGSGDGTVRQSTGSVPPPRGPRRARLQVRRIDPWSVLKFSLVLSVVLCIVMVVAVAVLYLLLSNMGVFQSINETVSSFSPSSDPDAGPLFTARSVIGVALVIGLADIVLFTALATLAAFAYNLCADLVGGIEVTLSEHE